MKVLLSKSFVTTILIFGIMAGFYTMPNVGFLDPIELAFKDFDLTDITFSKLSDDRPARIDTNVVIVNIGNLGRGDVAAVIAKLSHCKAAVIGVDALYWRPDTSDETQQLVQVAHMTPHLVLSSRLEYDDSPEGELSDSVTQIRAAIAGYDLSSVVHGYVNFSNDASGVRTIRNWQPATLVNGDTIQSFALRVLTEYSAYRHMPCPLPREEWLSNQAINYQKPRTYSSVESTDVLDSSFSSSIVEGKIVLMGFMGATLQDSSNYEDSFFSPLNEQYAGRSLPDIHGIEIHLNCLSMAMHNDLIRQVHPFISVSCSFLLCFLSVVLFALVDVYLPYFYDIICKSAQVVIALLLLVAAVYIFKETRFKTDPSLAVFAVVISADFYDMFNSGLEVLEMKWKNRKKLKTQHHHES